MRAYLAQDGLGPVLVKSASGSTGVSMLGMAFTFLLGWQLARGLGATGYGIYGVAMAVVSILGIPSQFGLPQLLTREVASANATHDWSRFKGVIRWAARIVSVSSLTILLLIGGWIVFAGPGLHSPLGSVLAVGALLVPLIALGAMSAAILRGLLAVVIAQIPDGLIRPAAHSLLLVGMGVLGITLTPLKAMGAGIVGAACSLVVGGLLVARYMPAPVIAAAPCEERDSWLHAALPMALTEGLRVMQGQAAILALGAMVSMADVGQFRVAASLMTLLVFPLGVLNLVAAPYVANLAATGDRSRLRRMLVHVSVGMTLSVLLMTLPFILAGHWLIATIFGAEFGAANSLVLVLALGTLANAAFGAGATTLNMLGHQQRVTRASIWSVAVLCGLLWPGITAFGAMGAAVAVTVAMTLWSALLWWDVRRLESMDIGAWALAAANVGRGEQP